MKRLIFSSLILGILLLCSLCCEKAVLDYCSQVYYRLEDCAKEINEERYPEAMGTVSEMLTQGKRKNILLSAFIGDGPAGVHYKSLTLLYGCLTDKNYQGSLEALRECQTDIREICKSTRTSLGNIL